MTVTRLSGRRGLRASDLVLASVLTLYTIIVAYPFYNAVLVSIVPSSVYLRYPLLIFPHRIDLSAYDFVLRSNSIRTGFINTTLITLIGVLYNLFLTTTAAYALSKPLPGRRVFNVLILATVYLSGGLIPFYLLVRGLGLIDSLWAMILPSGFSVLYMIVVRSFFVQLPDEIEESALIDGASFFTIFGRIVLPLSKAVLATFALYYAVERWNEWWFGMLFVRSGEKLPLQYVLRTIIIDGNSEMSTNMLQQMATYAEGVQMASIVVTMLPIMLVYPFLQRHFVKGVTLGAIK